MHSMSLLEDYYIICICHSVCGRSGGFQILHHSVNHANALHSVMSSKVSHA